MNVYVYAICKNEAGFAERWMDSMCEADAVFVTDTGSEDDTVERLRARGAVVFSERIAPWRFDAARNVSLSHVPEDADICVCTDLDEVFVPGWRAALEQAWSSRENAGQCEYLYCWSHREDGSPGVQFHYNKAHRRHGFVWCFPVHEALSYVGTEPLVTVVAPEMVLHHYPDASKSRGSYLGLLEQAVREAPEDARMRYYLGREYLFHARWQDCAATLSAYLELPGAGWNEERCAAMRHIAEAYHRLGLTQEAAAWYCRAVAEAPHMREPYVEYARFCQEREDWPTALLMSREALRISERSRTFVNTELAWDGTPEKIARNALERLSK